MRTSSYLTDEGCATRAAISPRVDTWRCFGVTPNLLAAHCVPPAVHSPMAGTVLAEYGQHFFGGKLVPLMKGYKALRPIACFETLRRAAKILASRCAGKFRDLLVPQIGAAVPSGLKAHEAIAKIDLMV